MPASKKLFPSRFPEQRRHVMDRYTEDHLTPDERMAEHKASLAVPAVPGHTVRASLRRLGDERPIVRAMYDRTVKPRKRRRKR